MALDFQELTDLAPSALSGALNGLELHRLFFPHTHVLENT